MGLGLNTVGVTEPRLGLRLLPFRLHLSLGGEAAIFVATEGPGPSHLALVSVDRICLGLQLPRLFLILSDGCFLKQSDCHPHPGRLVSL